MTYSFDVFDTLVTRNTATPKGIFAVMQKILIEGSYSSINDFVKYSFYQLRVGAEQVARNTYCKEGIDDVTLEQIYNVLVRGNQITEEAALFLQRLERQTEIQHAYGISENINRIKKLIAMGEKVILISDMYLDQDTIRAILRKVDTIFSEIPIYVSSESKKNKWTGNLFYWVKEKEQIDFAEWIHRGDNKHSDEAIPVRLGIKCERYGLEELLEIEKEYLKGNEDKAEIQLAIGCARNARMGRSEEAFRLGCGIGGRILYPYVKWILQDCLLNGINRLYFIARDGYVLKELADSLIRQMEYPIITKYIYGSRKAWRIPEREDNKEAMTEIYLHSYKDKIFCMDDLADFFQVSVEVLEKYVPVNMRDSRKVWSMNIVDLLVSQLLETDSFVEILKQKQEEKKSVLVKYLKQEIDMRDDKFAFVDLAGSGLTQECLAQIMRRFYAGKINNYFFRMDENRESICKNHIFYPNFVSYYVILEMICRAPQGQTIGYCEKEDGQIVPIFSEVDKEEIIHHGVPEFVEGVKRFGEIYNKVLQENENLATRISDIQFYLNYVYNTPDKTVLDFLGDMPDMLTGREKAVVTYAPRLTEKNIKDIYWNLQDRVGAYYYKGVDLRYSLKRCTEKQHKKICFYQKLRKSSYGEFCRKVYKVFARHKKEVTATIYDLIEKNIVIYGAGKRGQLFYKQITGRVLVNGIRYSSEVVLWTDKNYLEYQKKGLPVSALEHIEKVEYEQIVIAIARREIAQSIKEMLIRKGIEGGKILWLHPMIIPSAKLLKK